MGMNDNSIDLREDAIFKRITTYYWDNSTPPIDGNIWQWLERDYGATRTYKRQHAPGHGLDSFVVKFETPALKTAFVLRWA